MLFRAPSRASALLALLASFALASCGNDQDVEVDPYADAERVTVGAVAEVAQQVSASAPARVLSLNDTVISSEISATVEAILHRRGDTVDAGTTIIELDCDLYRFRLDGALARQRIAASDERTLAKDFKRHQELFEQGLISEEAYLAKKNASARGAGNAALSRSEVNAAQRNVDHCSVRAPFDAAVMEVHPSVGELLQPGARLARVLDISSIEVWADLNPLYAEGLEVGDAASFVQSDQEMPLRLVSKSAVPDLSTGNYKTRFEIIGEGEILSGSGEVVWQTRERFLESSYLRRIDGYYGVMLADGENARFAPVDKAREGWFIPIDGLDKGAQLIVEGRSRVAPDDLLLIEGINGTAAGQGGEAGGGE